MTTFVTPVLALSILLGACTSTSGENGGSQRAEAPAAARSFVLSRQQSSARLFEQSELPPGGRHFLEFVVTDVLNPARQAAIFNVVSIQPTGDEDIVGSFALFPPDNPGRFTVLLDERVESVAAIGIRVEFSGSPGVQDAFSVRVAATVKTRDSAGDNAK